MSDRARNLASELRDRFRLGRVLSDDDLARIADGTDLVIHDDEDIPGRHLDEAYMNGHLALRAGLEMPDRRRLTGHGLGHHVMHAGHRFVQGSATTARFEREADLFAGWLFLELDWAWMEPEELADEHRLPVAFVVRWLGLRGPPVRLNGQLIDPWDDRWNYA